jgi:hypothetical protein
MKMFLKLGLGLALALGLVAASPASDEMTVAGNVMCAKCSLKKDGFTKCQDVLVVKDSAGAVSEYYIEKNEVAKKFGHVCESEKAATVTGIVSEKDGLKWIAPSKMEETGS